MKLYVSEYDGKLRVVTIDQYGVPHVIENVVDGTMVITHKGSKYWHASLSFTFQE